MWEEFIEKYAGMQKKYEELPDLKDLDCEYEIKLFIGDKSSVPNFILRTVRRAMVTYITSWINLFHGYIVPNQGSGISMEEMKHFGVDEKREIAGIIDKLMFVSRSSALIELERSDKKEAEWIIETHKQWIEMKSELKKKVTKNVLKWKENFGKDKK